MTVFQNHPTAIIDEGATIGNGTKIWHWTHVSASAKIGENCSLGQNVYVGPNVVIGNNVKIQNNVSVFEGVILEDDVFCGPSMVFTNVYNPRSAIDRKAKALCLSLCNAKNMTSPIIDEMGASKGLSTFLGRRTLASRSVTICLAR